MARITANGVRAVAIISLALAALLIAVGQIRLGSLSLALAFLALAAARAQGVLPVTFWIRRARTDVAMALVLALILATLAFALPWGG